MPGLKPLRFTALTFAQNGKSTVAAALLRTAEEKWLLDHPECTSSPQSDVNDKAIARCLKYQEVTIGKSKASPLIPTAESGWSHYVQMWFKWLCRIVEKWLDSRLEKRVSSRSRIITWWWSENVAVASSNHMIPFVETCSYHSIHYSFAFVCTA